MAAKRCVLGLALANGIASAAQLKQRSSFLSSDPHDHTKEATLDTVQASHEYDSDFTADRNGRHSPTRQSWDTQEVQRSKEYHDDYTSDDRTMFTAAKSHTASTVSSRSLFDGAAHDGDWYMAQCDKINDQCEAKKERLRRKYAEDLAELKEEWERDEADLEAKENKHAAEKRDVKAQKKVVAREQKDVEAARKEVAEKDHCPADLSAAESELAALEAKPDKSPGDVDKECELRKKILKLKECVKELRAAEAVLRGEKDEHHTENNDLSEESSEERDAAGDVPPQKRETADAKAAYEAFKARGVRGIAEIEDECQEQRDALEREADEDVRKVENELSEQKSRLGEYEDTHRAEKADVVSQKGVVATEQKEVDAAHAEVKESEHCPPELETAQSRLSELEAKPDKTPQDVDEECELKKKILELKACVDRLRKAEAVLSKEHSDHREESADLRSERGEEADAAGRVPPQRSKVADLEADLAAAKAARAAICFGPNEKKSSPAPAPSPKKEPEPKSGAGRAAATTMAAIVVVLFSGAMQA